MTTNYTTKTASLKATQADIRKVEATKILVSPDGKSSSEKVDIIDIIDDVKDNLELIREEIQETINAIPEVQDATTEIKGIVTISDNNAIQIDEQSSAAATVTAVAATRSAIAEEMGALALTITGAQGAADAKVADITVDGTSIVSGAAGAKTAALTTTEKTEITPNAESVSSALATEASVAKALASIKSIGVSYKVLEDGQKHTDLSDNEIVNGRIYLEKDETNATAGIYIEWMYTEKGWEQIGSTKTDHSSYASTITVNDEAKPVSESSVDLGTFASTVADGTVSGTISTTGVLTLSVDTEALVSNNAIKASVTDANALVKASDALAAIKLAKPDNYVASVTGYTDEGSQVTTTPGAAIKVLDERGTSVTVNDLWGTTATMDANGVVTIEHNWITNPNSPRNPWSNLITKVEDNKAYVGYTLYGNIQTNMIKNSSDMFYTCKNLTSFSSDLSNLKDGEMMFIYCNKLESFSADLSSLTNGSNMFVGCQNLKSFSSDLSNLKDGTGMFVGCTNLPSFSSDLSSLTNGSWMFYDCALASFASDLPNSKDCSYMFYGCTFTSFNSDLSSLKNSRYMFHNCTDLTTFSSDLANLEDGGYMFYNCADLASITSDLSNLKDGEYMFYKCALASFVSDLSSLINGEGMFSYCNNLKSFSSDLSNLKDGNMMFYNCALASFVSDLSSLTDGTWMFGLCNLDTESVEIIADTINDVTSLTPSYNITKRIDIMINNTTPNDEEDAAFKHMQDKGWDVYVNSSIIEYVPRTGEASLDETSETTVAPKPYWAKPIEVTEDKAEYVGQDGKFYQVVGGQFIYVNEPETYGMFVSREDAIANMRLTKYEKPVEEA